MRIVLQRVLKAEITIDKKETRNIDRGLVLLLGIESNDTIEDLNWLVRKVINMRIFSDKDGKMNLSLLDINGDILLVSQFTLYASTKQGNRPSFIKAAPPTIAIPIYNQIISKFEMEIGHKIITGEFGADMLVNIHNNGPVTILLDSKNKE